MSPRQLYFDPWSDDRTTTPYDSRHFLSLQQAHTARLPSRPLAAAPSLRAVPPVLAYDRDEDENPFAARGMTFGRWFLTLAAAAGVFAALLFGRVLVEASKPASAPASTPLTAAEAPAGSAPAVSGAVAASTIALPSIARDKGPAREPRAKHSRRRSSRRETSADESAARAEASPRSGKTRSAAVRRREVRASKSQSSALSAPSRENRETDSSASKATPGLLRINSRPWSQVFIDGKLIGNTPQLGVQLAPGKHSVRLVNAEFGMTKSFTFKLGAGESVTRVEMLAE